MLGELKRLQFALAQSHAGPTLTLVLTNLDEEDLAQDLKKLSEVTGEQWRLPPVAVGRVGLCPGGAAEAILLTAVPHPAVPGVTNWLLADSIHGPGGFEHVERRIRERLHIPVGRPMSPSQRSGTILFLRSPERDLILRAAYQDAALDWVEVEEMMLIYCENTDVEDWLIELGAGRLTRSVRKASLYLQTSHAAADPLWRGNKLSLVSMTEEAARGAPDAVPWSQSRQRRLP